MVLLGFLSFPASAFLTHLFAKELSGFVTLGLFLVVRGAMGWSVYRLATELATGKPILWGFGAFIPNFLGLVVLGLISGRATTFLRKAGLKVGLLGATVPEQPLRR